MDRGGEQGGRAHPPAGGEGGRGLGSSGYLPRGEEGGGCPTSEGGWGLAGSGNGGVGGEVVGMGEGGGGANETNFT